MDKKHDLPRNHPTEEGRNNDPDMRDDSAIQPGVQTVSDSRYDDNNQNTTSSALSDGTISEFDTETNADPAFDDMIDDKNKG